MAKDKEKEVESRRKFELPRGDKVLEYYLNFPSADEIRKADWHYSKVYNKALMDGVATEAEMLDILEQRGLYGPEYNSRIEKLQLKISEKIVQMETEKNDEVRKKLAKEVGNARNELFRWNQRLNGPLSNTCEQMADDAKTEYLTSVMVEDKEGKKLWQGYEDFLNEPDAGLSMKARLEVLLMFQGLDTDFMEKTPERRVLREIEKTESTPKLDAGKEESVAEESSETKKAPAKKKTTRRRKTAKTASK